LKPDAALALLGLQHFAFDFSAGFARRRLHLVIQEGVEGLGGRGHGSQGGNGNNSSGNKVRFHDEYPLKS
jgi:hypothetical protein